jgi:hypothetical protein
MLSLCLDKSINLGDAPLLDGLEGQPGSAVIEGPCDATPGSVLVFKLLRGVLRYQRPSSKAAHLRATARGSSPSLD